jgi:hypothetical protein
MGKYYVSEDDCTLCGRMWRSEREAFRSQLDWLPMDEPVCNACLLAFFRNIGLPVRDDPTEH